MELSTETSVVIPKPREEVFDFCTDDENTARTLRPLGPIAGVAKIQMHEGQSLETGARRTITMTDGVALVEEILDYTRPTRHQYRWVGGIKPPFAWLVRSGTGCWEFSEVSGGTRCLELRVRAAIAAGLPFGLTDHLSIQAMDGPGPRRNRSRNGAAKHGRPLHSSRGQLCERTVACKMKEPHPLFETAH